MTTLILCRHGRTDWNDLGRYQGQTDVPLNEEGWHQATLLAEVLRDEPITAVYSSDLARAMDTALEIARPHLLSVQRDQRLREINQGRWEGLTVRQIRERDAELQELWEAHPLQVTLPGGESVGDVRRRVLVALREMVDRNREGLICLVSHKVVMTVIRCELTGAPLEPALRRFPENASVERVEVPPDFALDLA